MASQQQLREQLDFKKVQLQVIEQNIGKAMVVVNQLWAW